MIWLAQTSITNIQNEIYKRGGSRGLLRSGSRKFSNHFHQICIQSLINHEIPMRKWGVGSGTSSTVDKHLRDVWKYCHCLNRSFADVCLLEFRLCVNCMKFTVDHSLYMINVTSIWSATMCHVTDLVLLMIIINTDFVLQSFIVSKSFWNIPMTVNLPN